MSTIYDYDADKIAAFEKNNHALIWDDERVEVDGKNVCEGCFQCAFPGIRWPASPDGYSDYSYVDRCDYCERYKSDEAAAKFLAEKLGVRWGYAEREHPENIRWAPAEDDDRDYTGWSCFIDRPERDG